MDRLCTCDSLVIDVKGYVINRISKIEFFNFLGLKGLN